MDWISDSQFIESSEHLFDIISSGRTRLKVSQLCGLLISGRMWHSAMNLMEETDIPDCSDIADFYEIDSRVISLIKHAINAKSPIAFMFNNFPLHMGLGIIKKILERKGILYDLSVPR